MKIDDKDANEVNEQFQRQVSAKQEILNDGDIHKEERTVVQETPEGTSNYLSIIYLYHIMHII